MIQQTINAKNIEDIGKHDEQKHVVGVNWINKRKMYN
jgi:hypothetical protein